MLLGCEKVDRPCGPPLGETPGSPDAEGSRRETVYTGGGRLAVTPERGAGRAVGGDRYASALWRCRLSSANVRAGEGRHEFRKHASPDSIRTGIAARGEDGVPLHTHENVVGATLTAGAPGAFSPGRLRL